MANGRDFAHQTSHRLAASDHRIFVVEDLKIKNMTASPAPQPKADGNGSEPNGTTAKAGLNRSILAAAWGMVVTFLKYKALRRRKLVISIAAYRSSPECARCGHIHPANRVSQSQFHCQRCGHIVNADHTGAQVVKQRGIAALKTKSAGASPSSPAGTRPECASRECQTPEGQPTGAARNSSFSETGKKREPPRGRQPTVVRRKTRNGSLAIYGREVHNSYLKAASTAARSCSIPFKKL